MRSVASNNSIFNLFRSRSREALSTKSLPSEARLYLSRQFQTLIRDKDLPLPTHALGIKSPVGLVLLFIRSTVPFCYMYIAQVILHAFVRCSHHNDYKHDDITDITMTITNTFNDVCEEHSSTILLYLPASLSSYLLQPPPPTTIVWTLLIQIITIWSFIEILFDVFQRMRFRWLQSISPIETSLSAAPIMEIHERTTLWRNIMNQSIEDDGNLVAFITGWFFDVDGLENLTVYDVMDWITWCLFEGRNQEHLTDEEKLQVKEFISELEWRLSLHLHGEHTEEVKNSGEEMTTITDDSENGRERGHDNSRNGLTSIVGKTLQFEKNNAMDAMFHGVEHITMRAWNNDPCKRTKPKEEFHFRESKHEETPFLNLYEALHKTFIKTKSDTSSRLNRLRAYVDQKRRKTRTAASNAYENIANRVSNIGVGGWGDDGGSDGDNDYGESDGENSEGGGGWGGTGAGGSVLKSLSTTLSHATYHQLEELWDSVCRMKERLELKRQLKGYRIVLSRMVDMNAGVHSPTSQMADILANITSCEERLIKVEQAALMAFWNASEAGKSLARKVTLRKEHYTPQRYARYSSDPLLGHSARYPLGFHLAMYGLTDGVLRIIMKKKGFKRMKIASTSYYYHPGIDSDNDDEHNHDSDDEIDDTEYHNSDKTPIVFCHGIGVGIIYYEYLIDELLKLQRPLFLPEIPYVSGFRPWMSRHAVLTPPAVTSTLTAMLATRGYLQACFVGHSYGTSWLSYMCKYAPHAVASVVFLDPICFCLHHSTLTKSFVYHRTDPGSLSSIVMTDLTVIWTIQRNFPWARIILFREEIPTHVPWRVYLSEKDFLLPVKTVEKYFKNKGVPIADYRVGGENDIFQVEKRRYRQSTSNLDDGDGSSSGVFVFQGDGHGDWSKYKLPAVHIANNVRILIEEYESNEDDG